MNSVLLFVFLWAKGLNANQIHPEMCPVNGDECSTRPAMRVWCMEFARGRESIVDKERPGRHVVATTATIASADAFVPADKYLNELGQYVEK